MMKVRNFAVLFSIIIISGISLAAFAQTSSIPSWLKNNAKWWAEGTITDADYISGLQYLINQGILNIPVTDNDSTATIQNSPYVPFHTQTGDGNICDESSGWGDTDMLIIENTGTSGDFIITGLLFEIIGVDDQSDSVHIQWVSIDGTTRQLTTVDLTGSESTLFTLDVMGADLRSNGKFPTQLSTSSNGENDIKIGITCNAGSSSNIELRFVVTGWKQSSDTITLTYSEDIF